MYSYSLRCLGLPSHKTEILITTPFHPGYLTADLIKKAEKLKLCVTAGVGSDHVDLNAANEKQITVAEVSHEHHTANVVASAKNANLGLWLQRHQCSRARRHGHPHPGPKPDSSSRTNHQR